MPLLQTKSCPTKVGENLPCASENTAPWSPMAGYDHDTGYDGMQDMDIETFTQDIDWAANAVYDSHKYETRGRYLNDYCLLFSTSIFYKRVANVIALQHHKVTDEAGGNKVVS